MEDLGTIHPSRKHANTLRRLSNRTSNQQESRQAGSYYTRRGYNNKARGKTKHQSPQNGQAIRPRHKTNGNDQKDENGDSVDNNNGYRRLRSSNMEKEGQNSDKYANDDEQGNRQGFFVSSSDDNEYDDSISDGDEFRNNRSKGSRQKREADENVPLAQRKNSNSKSSRVVLKDATRDTELKSQSLLLNYNDVTMEKDITKEGVDAIEIPRKTRSYTEDDNTPLKPPVSGKQSHTNDGNLNNSSAKLISSTDSGENTTKDLSSTVIENEERSWSTVSFKYLQKSTDTNAQPVPQNSSKRYKNSQDIEASEIPNSQTSIDTIKDTSSLDQDGDRRDGLEELDIDKLKKVDPPADYAEFFEAHQFGDIQTRVLMKVLLIFNPFQNLSNWTYVHRIYSWWSHRCDIPRQQLPTLVSVKDRVYEVMKNYSNNQLSASELCNGVSPKTFTFVKQVFEQKLEPSVDHTKSKKSLPQSGPTSREEFQELGHISESHTPIPITKLPVKAKGSDSPMVLSTQEEIDELPTRDQARASNEILKKTAQDENISHQGFQRDTDTKNSAEADIAPNKHEKSDLSSPGEDTNTKNHSLMKEENENINSESENQSRFNLELEENSDSSLDSAHTPESNSKNSKLLEIQTDFNSTWSNDAASAKTQSQDTKPDMAHNVTLPSKKHKKYSLTLDKYVDEDESDHDSWLSTELEKVPNQNGKSTNVSYLNISESTSKSHPTNQRQASHTDSRLDQLLSAVLDQDSDSEEEEEEGRDESPESAQSYPSLGFGPDEISLAESQRVKYNDVKATRERFQTVVPQSYVDDDEEGDSEEFGLEEEVDGNVEIDNEEKDNGEQNEEDKKQDQREEEEAEDDAQENEDGDEDDRPVYSVKIKKEPEDDRLSLLFEANKKRPHSHRRESFPNINDEDGTELRSTKRMKTIRRRPRPQTRSRSPSLESRAFTPHVTREPTNRFGSARVAFDLHQKDLVDEEEEEDEPRIKTEPVDDQLFEEPIRTKKHTIYNQEQTQDRRQSRRYISENENDQARNRTLTTPEQEQQSRRRRQPGYDQDQYRYQQEEQQQCQYYTSEPRRMRRNRHVLNRDARFEGQNGIIDNNDQVDEEEEYPEPTAHYQDGNINEEYDESAGNNSHIPNFNLAHASMGYPQANPVFRDVQSYLEDTNEVMRVMIRESSVQSQNTKSQLGGIVRAFTTLQQNQQQALLETTKVIQLENTRVINKLVEQNSKMMDLVMNAQQILQNNTQTSNDAVKDASHALRKIADHNAQLMYQMLDRNSNGNNSNNSNKLNGHTVISDFDQGLGKRRQKRNHV